MKIQLLLLLTFLFFSLTSGFSQYEFGVSAGTSTPLGAFSGNELEDGGFADQGFVAMVDFAQHIKPRFGITEFFSYQSHGLDNVDLEDAYFSELPDFLESVRIQPSDYRTFLIMVGPFYSIPLSENWQVRVKAGGGLFHTNLDDQRFSFTVISETGTRQVIVDASAEGSSRFSYFAGAAVHFDVAPSWLLKLDLTYSGASPSISLETIDEVARESEQKVAFLNFAVGLAYFIE